MFFRVVATGKPWHHFTKTPCSCSSIHTCRQPRCTIGVSRSREPCQRGVFSLYDAQSTCCLARIPQKTQFGYQFRCFFFSGGGCGQAIRCVLRFVPNPCHKQMGPLDVCGSSRRVHLIRHPWHWTVHQGDGVRLYVCPFRRTPIGRTSGRVLLKLSFVSFPSRHCRGPIGAKSKRNFHTSSKPIGAKCTGGVFLVICNRLYSCCIFTLATTTFDQPSAVVLVRLGRWDATRPETKFSRGVGWSARVLVFGSLEFSSKHGLLNSQGTKPRTGNAPRRGLSGRLGRCGRRLVLVLRARFDCRRAFLVFSWLCFRFALVCLLCLACWWLFFFSLVGTNPTLGFSAQEQAAGTSLHFLLRLRVSMSVPLFYASRRTRGIEMGLRFLVESWISGVGGTSYHLAQNDYRNAWCRFNCFFE